MSLERKYLICFSLTLALAFIYYGCGSGEYELEEHKIDYVEKTLKYDTVKKVVVVDTTGNNKIKDNSTKDSYSYIVQLGAFAIESNFQNFYGYCKSKLGDQVFYEFSNNLYKIRIGKYSDKAEALKQLAYAKENGFYDAFIVTVKK